MAQEGPATGSPVGSVGRAGLLPGAGQTQWSCMAVGPASDRGQATFCGEWKAPIWTPEEEGLSLGQQATWDPRPERRGEGCRCRGLRLLVWLHSDDS